MKLNKSKSYGVITGHSQAMFEQDGKLFDGAGEVLSEKKEKLAVETNTDNEFKLESAVAFLKNMLEKGPVNKKRIVMEAEQQQQEMEFVHLAFAKLEARTKNFGAAETWFLN